MEKIIQQIVVNYTKTFYETAISGISDLDLVCSNLKILTEKMANEITTAILKEMNEDLRKDKKTRKELGLVIKEKNRPRVILTEIGDIRYERDYYYNKVIGKYESTIDELISVEKRERIGKGICAKLLEKATEYSYQKSSKEVTEGKVSRQTVHNIVKKAPLLEADCPKEKKQVKELHIYADEDHVHLQRPNKQKGKRNTILPLITITEGIEKVSHRRNKTINPVRFTGKLTDEESLWQTIDGYIASAYNLEETSTIYIYGDGANWIKNGKNRLSSQAEFVLDKFHFRKDLKVANRMNPKAKLTTLLIEAAKEDNHKKAVEALDKWSQGFENKQQEEVTKHIKYYMNNWDGIVNSYQEGTTGSCTEGQVSHVFSERFSRNPMGWSQKNLETLAATRVYVLNGGKITREILSQDRIIPERYQEISERLIEENIKGLDWTIFMEEMPHHSEGNYRFTENGKKIRLVC